MTTADVANQIEAVLFYKAAPQKKATLIKLLDLTEETFLSGLTALKHRLEKTALSLIETDTTIELVTSPLVDSLIEKIRKDELRRDIGQAGAETLAIILYRGPITRGAIDRIRGVNSAFILRNLLVRGLIEKVETTPYTTYGATTSLLAHLGISHKSALPNYTEYLAELEKFEDDSTDEAGTGQDNS